MKKYIYIFASVLLCLTSQAQKITTVAGSSIDGVLATSSPLPSPYGVTLDASGNFYIADLSNHRIRKVAAGTGIITTVAGNGTGGFSGDGGAATAAKLNNPASISVDGSGNLYIADRQNYRIRKVAASTGIISTVAGNGTGGFSGDGGAATAANLSSPSGVSVDGLGNLYIAEEGNHRIRKVAAGTGIISTVAGNGTGGFSGDGGAATAAKLNSPSGVSVDGLGNLYIADRSNNRIRKVAAGTGIISTIAGNGTGGFSGDGSAATAANLNNPTGILFDVLGNLYIADRFNHRIRKVAAGTGIISTIAGNGTGGFGGDGGAATTASLFYPSVILVDGSGNLYIADPSNYRIRKVAAGTGIITTVAGNGTAGFSGDGGAATAANLYNPSGVSVDGSGNLYIADQYNHRIRKVAAGTGIITTIAGNGISGFSGDGGAATVASIYNPTGVSIDSLGNLYIADQNNHRIRKIAAGTGIITTVAGNGTGSFSGDGSLATAAQLYYPTGVYVDGLGNLFIADQNNHRIRKVAAGTGIITTVAGNGTSGFSGDGGAATTANLNYPTGVAVDGFGNLYIADNNNNRIRKVTIGTGIITTVAGNGTAGFSGDGGAATAANLYNPTGISVDGSGNLFIADNNNHRIRKVDAGTGIITTIAGIGTDGFSGDEGAATAAKLNNPTGITVDNLGNVYIADEGNNRIRKVFYYNYIVSGNQTICFGSTPDSIMANTPTGGNGTYTYGWQYSTTSDTTNFFAIPSSNTKNYKPIAITQNTWYKRYIVSGSFTDTSTAVLLAVNAKPSVGFKINNATQCINGNSFLYTDTSTISSGTFTRLWNFGDASTATTSTFTKTYSNANTYQVKLVTISNLGCKDSIIKTVIVNPKPLLGFTTNIANQCLNTNNYLFADTSKISSGTLNRLWTLGNGDTTSIINPSKVFSNAGTYSIKLLAISDNGCKDSLTKTVTVYPNTKIGFKINNATQCVNGNSFLYTDTSTISSGTFTRLWNFGDASTATTSPITKTYSNANTYQVKLVTTSNLGCKDSITKTVIVNPKPLLGFTTNTANQCVNTNNYLFADTSIISTGTISRLWTLGNGDTTSIINPTKIFNNAGTYNIKLHATSDNGCKDSITKTVTVYPNTKFGFKINNATQCVNGNSFLYTDTSTISSGNFTRLWNFGDASTATTSPITKTYSIANTYQIKLVTTSNLGCKDSIIKTVIVNPKPDVYFMINNETQCLKGNQFSFTDSSVISNGSLTLKWNLGDGSIDSVLVANKKYNQANTYHVKLVVSSNNACKDSITRDVVVNPQPLSVATSQGRTIICPSEMVNIKATTTNGNSYQWLKNEVLLPSAIDSALQTSAQGIYKVITSTTFACADTSQGVSIVVNPLPKAQIGINNAAQCLAGNQFLYTDSSTLLSGSLHRFWYLNNVLSDTTFNINKSYNAAGNYSVKLVSISETNCKDSITKTVVVHPQPIPDFTINNATQCLEPNNFVFTDVSTIASGNTTRTWYTGNGNNATSETATQVYSIVGNHSVKLVSKSDKACSDSISKTITINANPVAGVMLGQTTNVAPTTPYIYTVSQQLNHSYLWSITNGIIVAGQGTNVVTIQWIGVGTGKIQTIITNPQGCNDTSSLILNISNVGINEVQNTFHLQVFPNPNNGSFVIKAINSKTSNTQISVVNMLGQEVWSTTQIIPLGLQEIPINTNLSAGIYLLRFQNENGQVIKNIVVE